MLAQLPTQHVHVLLETRTSETDGSLQELGSDTRVLSDGVGDLVDVGTGGLTDGTEHVDGRDTLGEHGVGGQLGELGRPKSDGQDPLLGDPVGVDVGESGASVDTLLGLERSDEDPVRGKEVLDGGTLGQELGVGQDVEPTARLGVGLEDGPHGPVRARKERTQRNGQCSRSPAAARRVFPTHSAVLQGTVDFSTTILELVETSAILRVANSM